MSIEELRLESDRRLATVVFVVVLIPAVWFGAVTPSDRGFWTLDGLAPHVASAVVAILALWFVRRARTRAQFSGAVFAATLAIVPVFVTIALQQPQGWFYQPSQAILPLVAMYGALPNSVLRQVVPPLLLTAFLMFARIWMPGRADQPLGADLVVLALINAIGVVMVRRRAGLQNWVSEAWDRERAARAAAERALNELHTLRGIIPICSNCKKVRTDAGDWQQVEQYVHEHSAAQFSHGICPDCARKLYPDILPPDSDS
ncbi:MAG: hypothetical protein WC815_05110 [Vicinamibacterales bacterium]|jgi:hypothetical protein